MCAYKTRIMMTGIYFENVWSAVRFFMCISSSHRPHVIKSVHTAVAVLIIIAISITTMIIITYISITALHYAQSMHHFVGFFFSWLLLPNTLLICFRVIEVREKRGKIRADCLENAMNENTHVALTSFPNLL